MTRISSLQSQFRKVRYENDNYLRDVYKKVGENFIKYALSKFYLKSSKLFKGVEK